MIVLRRKTFNAAVGNAGTDMDRSQANQAIEDSSEQAQIQRAQEFMNTDHNQMVPPQLK